MLVNKVEGSAFFTPTPYLIVGFPNESVTGGFSDFVSVGVSTEVF